MRIGARFGIVITVVLLTPGCGYRLVRNSDVTAKRFAADSASIESLQQELAALTLRARTDSIRLANDLAVQTAATAALQRAPVAASSDSLLKARTAEVTALKDQLTKVSAELDRIKRRLASPRP